ncbi:hypothetical protein CLIB1444_03S02806 [[Candida] jaroonii]|uniref:Uncharacterized protein n=1 Tax=[Candida] jaroonii TaxID=467808 RepID=A0ACA9Y4W1_9ASCO|nr:hypothetical protein CLIB1444_03S02806 [[Candida] jaroonii]
MQVRCLSCRKLKIGCDKARPKCEYCRSTGRECVYVERQKKTKVKKITKAKKNIDKIDDKLNDILSWELPDNGSIEDFNLDGSKSGSESVSGSEYMLNTDSFDSQSVSGESVELEYWNDLTIPAVNDLNCGHIQLGISKFEYRLLVTFPRLLIGDKIDWAPHEQMNPMEQIWLTDIPSLWQESSIIRNNIFSLTSMILYRLTDASELILEDLGPTAIYQGFKYDISEDQDQGWNGDFIDKLISPPESPESIGSVKSPKVPDALVKNELYIKTLSYFNDSINQTCTTIDQILAKDELEVFEAAEVSFSALLLFTFLGLQDFNLVKLINFEPNQPLDLVSLVKTMKPVIGKSFPVLYNTKYHRIFYLSELLSPKIDVIEFPIIENLRNWVYNFEFDEKYKQAFGKILRAIEIFNLCLTRGLKENEGSLVVRWIFLLDFSVYDLMLNHDVIGLKLLNFYSFVCVVNGFQIKSGIFHEYMDWYITNQDYDSEDLILFDYVKKNKRITMEELTEFNPKHRRS